MKKPKELTKEQLKRSIDIIVVNTSIYEILSCALNNFHLTRDPKEIIVNFETLHRLDEKKKNDMRTFLLKKTTDKEELKKQAIMINNIVKSLEMQKLDNYRKLLYNTLMLVKKGVTEVNDYAYLKPSPSLGHDAEVDVSFKITMNKDFNLGKDVILVLENTVKTTELSEKKQSKTTKTRLHFRISENVYNALADVELVDTRTENVDKTKN